jgi:hypothetical protein
MKSKQRGDVVLITAAAYLVAGFLVLTGQSMVKNEQAPNAPVYHNYNGGFTK